MRLVCDENLRNSYVAVLEQEHHDVKRVQDVLETGVSDGVILEYCQEEDAVLVTNDDDLLGLDASEHAGIVYVTDQTHSPREIARAIERIEELLDRETIAAEELFVPDGWT